MFDSFSIVGLLIMMLAIISIGLGFAHVERGSPVLAILNRWLRWILFSLAVGYLLQELEWSGRPFWALSLIAFLVWFLLETGYNWLAINALSRSEIPLFPRFEKNVDGDEWPAQPRYLKVREWLRSEGFRRRDSLKASLMEEMELRSSIYENKDQTIRLQVLFIPQRKSNLSACYIFSSPTGEEGRIITDNIFIPFGGFYPERWKISRRPLTRSPKSLLKAHQQRLRKSPDPVLPWPERIDPIEDLNDQQRILEKTNTDLGFLLPRYLHEEHGKITPAGRYRVWKEIWLLNYLGLPMAYH
jgi:hypothetical protein